jgi:hypothetical protein
VSARTQVGGPSVRPALCQTNTSGPFHSRSTKLDGERIAWRTKVHRPSMLPPGRRAVGLRQDAPNVVSSCLMSAVAAVPLSSSLDGQDDEGGGRLTRK